MCGSLLSKFKTPRNKIDSAMMIFPEPRRVASKMKLSNQDVACFQDREFWRDGDPHREASVQSSGEFRSKNSLSDDRSSESDKTSQDEIEATVRALAEGVRAPPRSYERNNRVKPRRLVSDRDQQLMDTAREILAFHAYGASSSSNTVRAVQPLSSTDSTLPRKQVKTAVTFDIPVGDKKTVCPPARVPRRLRKSKVAPERTLEDVKEKLRAAEERKLEELQCIQECARSRAGVSRPRPVETSAQATTAKIAAKQAAVESKWHEEMEKRKQPGNRASTNKSRIAAAQAFAKAQVQPSIKQKVDETEQRKEELQQKIDEQNKLRGKHAKMSQEEEEIHADLPELDTYNASDDGNDSLGDKQENAFVYGWEDFFSD